MWSRTSSAYKNVLYLHNNSVYVSRTAVCWIVLNCTQLRRNKIISSCKPFIVFINSDEVPRANVLIYKAVQRAVQLQLVQPSYSYTNPSIHSTINHRYNTSSIIKRMMLLRCLLRLCAARWCCSLVQIALVQATYSCSLLVLHS